MGKTHSYSFYPMQNSILSFVLFVIWLPFSSVAQQHYQDSPKAQNISLPTLRSGFDTESRIAGFISRYYDLDHYPSIRFQLHHTRRSPYSVHYTYAQYYHGYPVYNATISVVTDLEGRLISASDNAIVPAHFKPEDKVIPPASGREAACLAAGQCLYKGPDPCWFFIDATTCVPAYYTEITGYSSHQAVLCDLSGAVLYTRDLQDYAQDSTVQVHIFDPDPLTTAGVSYGGAYSDNEDQTNASLENQQQWRSIACAFDENTGLFTLENEIIKIVSLVGDSPFYAVATSLQPSFNYNRSEPGFEDVMAYYHLTHYLDYVHSLDDGLCSGSELWVDTHALSTFQNGEWVAQDQSSYNGILYPPVLRFGLGGVDDAEDADVLIHEFGHALSNCANGGTNSGTERKAIEEANCDYFALSYSLERSDFKWGEVFTWDGHNEFWPGRNANNQYFYPNIYDAPELQAEGISIYDLSLLWSGMLMDIYWELGRDVLDPIVLEMLYHLENNMSFEQAAEALVNAEQLVFQGVYHQQITTKLAGRGLWDPAFSAGPDTEVCLGDEVVLGGNFPQLAGLSVSWRSADNMFASTAFNPTIRPGFDNDYYLTVENFNTQEIIRDTVHISVHYCGLIYDSLFNVRNSDLFFSAGGPLIIQHAEGKPADRYQLIDLNGRMLADEKGQSDALILYYPTRLDAGIYFLRVWFGEEEKVYKIAKGRY